MNQGWDLLLHERMLIHKDCYSLATGNGKEPNNSNHRQAAIISAVHCAKVITCCENINNLQLKILKSEEHITKKINVNNDRHLALLFWTMQIMLTT